MTSHEHSSDIADEKVVQTLYMFAGKAGQHGTPTHEIHDSLMARDLDSQVARAVVNELSSLREQAQYKRKAARRYQAASLALVLAGITIALLLQAFDVSTVTSLVIAWAAILSGGLVYMRGRTLAQTTVT